MKGNYTSSSSSHSSGSTCTCTSTTLTLIIKIVAFFSLVSFSLFSLFKQFSANTATPDEHLRLFNSTHTNNTLAPVPAPPPQPRRKARPVVEKTGIINEFGIMTSDFMVGEFDEGLIQSVAANAKIRNGERNVKRENDEGEVIKAQNFRVCDMSMTDYVPYFENVETISQGLDCLVPKPNGYKHPMPWPKCRDEVWFDNVRYMPENNEGSKRVSKKDGKLKFGRLKSEKYLSKMVPEIAFGKRTRVALDIIGSGRIANLGAYLMERNVTTLSVAQKVDSKQVQIALERGIPAMVTTFGTRRLPFPSQAFDLIGCARCVMDWTRDDGVLLLEANRMLRGGGYFVWEAEAVYNYEDKLGEQWREMEDLTRNLCWELVNKEGYIAIWQKTVNNSCYLDRDPDVQPSLCDIHDDPDDIWNVKMKNCIARLPENGNRTSVTIWPSRLHSLPNRLFSIKTDSDVSRQQLYRADKIYWNAIVHGYASVFKINEVKIRNVMDMNAKYGGFAAALLESKANSWVMNVVPVSGPNTLPVIYDRGLIGVMHDWCEPFATYPRSYDLINAAGLFSKEQRRCNVTNIMVEMDRILRPEGRVYICDSTAVIYDLREIATTMGWMVNMFDTEEGPYSNWKLLICTKPA